MEGIKKEDVPSNQAYIIRRLAHQRFKDRLFKEKIRKVTNKVDNYLKKHGDDPLMEIAKKEVFKEDRKKASKEEIEATVNRLYKVKNKREKAVDKKKKQVEDRKEKQKPKEKLKINFDKQDKIFKEGYVNTEKLPKLHRPKSAAVVQENKKKYFSYVLDSEQAKKAYVPPEDKERQELRQIIKEFGYDLHKLEQFKNKNKHIDISNYIHKAQVEFVKKNKPKKQKSAYSQLTQQAKMLVNTGKKPTSTGFLGSLMGKTSELNKVEEENQESVNEHEEFSEEVGDEEIMNENKFVEEEMAADQAVQGDFEEKEQSEGSKTEFEVENLQTVKKESFNATMTRGTVNTNTKTALEPKQSYLAACRLNDTEFIKAHVLSAEEEEEIERTVNSITEEGWKGLTYLIFWANYDMIKLAVISGVDLKSCTDCYKRNIFHWVAMSQPDNYHLLEFFLKCIKLPENKLFSFVEKSFLTIRQQTVSVSPETLSSLEEQLRVTAVDQEASGNSFFTGLRNKPTSAKHLLTAPDRLNRTPLHYAVLYSNIELTKKIVENDGFNNVRDLEGNTPIDLASSETLKKYLLINGDKRKKTFLMGLAGLLPVQPDYLENLQHKSKDMICKIKVGHEKNSLLVQAVLDNNLDLFRYLAVERGIPVDCKNLNGWNLLHFVAKTGHLEFLNILFNLEELDNLPDFDFSMAEDKTNRIATSFSLVDSINNAGQDPVFAAVDTGNTRLVKFFLEIIKEREQISSLKAKNYCKMSVFRKKHYGKSEINLLHLCVKNKNSEMFLFLLEEGFSLDVEDCFKKNLLHYAVECEFKDMVHFLVKNTSGMFTLSGKKDSKGKKPGDYSQALAMERELTSIWEAVKSGNTDKVEDLLEAELYTVDDANKKGMTPIHVACQQEDLKMVLYLVKKGANLENKTKTGKMPFDIVMQSKKERFKKAACLVLEGAIDSEEKLREHQRNVSCASAKRKESAVMAIISKITRKIREMKLNIETLFTELDSNKNGFGLNRRVRRG